MLNKILGLGPDRRTAPPASQSWEVVNTGIAEELLDIEDDNWGNDPLSSETQLEPQKPPPPVPTTQVLTDDNYPNDSTVTVVADPEVHFGRTSPNREIRDLTDDLSPSPSSMPRRERHIHIVAKNGGEILTDIINTEEGVTIARVAGLILNWVLEYFPDMPSNYRYAAGTAVHIKNFFSALQLPQQITKIVYACERCYKVLSFSNFTKILKKISDCVISVLDVLGLSTLVARYNLAALTWFKGLGIVFIGVSSALSFFKTGCEVVEKWSDLDGWIWSYFTIKTFRDICYIAFSVIAGLAFLGIIAPPPLVILVVLSVGLALTIIGITYKGCVRLKGEDLVVTGEVRNRSDLNGHFRSSKKYMIYITA